MLLGRPLTGVVFSEERPRSRSQQPSPRVLAQGLSCLDLDQGLTFTQTKKQGDCSYSNTSHFLVKVSENNIFLGFEAILPSLSLKYFKVALLFNNEGNFLKI